MAEVTTQGTGLVEQIADYAQVDVAYEAIAETRSEAIRALTAHIVNIEPILDQTDLEVRSRQVSAHSNWDGNQYVGSRARQQYQLRVTHLDKLDDILNALVAGEPAWLNGPYWELLDRADATKQAQHLAVAEAKTRAEGYAGALGARLGSLQRLADSGTNHMWSGRMTEQSVGSYGSGGEAPLAIKDLRLEASLITISASCTATWALLFD